jgi:3-hydroxybutyryl-CoA dehydrogenase
MGRGIAHAFAYAGHTVWLIDVKRRSAKAAAQLQAESLAEVRANLATLAKLGAFSSSAIPAILRRIRFAARGEAADALGRCDVLFEGVPEVMETKREGFAFACRHLRPDTIVSSTTSTFLVDSLAGMVTAPERFLNGHWLNPAYLVPLVEVSPHAGTAPEVLARFNALLESIGKVPVVCKPAPGFIVPRMQSLIMSEAARMVEEGVASAEDIDRAVRYGFGFRFANMGAVEFIDYGGVDILHYAGNYLADVLGERFRPPAIIGRHMEAGRKGMREGKGFFDWSTIDPATYREESLGRLVKMLRYHGMLRGPARAAARALAGAPRKTATVKSTAKKSLERPARTGAKPARPRRSAPAAR